MERFDISTAQAAVDFRTYLTLSKTPPDYDGVKKSYIAAPDHRPLAQPSPAQVFDVLNDPNPPNVSAIPLPNRAMDYAAIALLYQTIRSGRDLRIIYTSMKSGASNPQWIGPARFHFDGEAIHLRAWSYKHSAYRDYLPIRMSFEEDASTRTRPQHLPHDTEWQTMVRMRIRPRYDLSEAQARVVRREYGFEQAPNLVVETRKALAFYLIRRWRLGEDEARLELEGMDEID